MCRCDNAEYPSASRMIMRKAAKAHWCTECGKEIRKGDRYQYISGIWDGRPDEFKTCLPCVAMRDAHKAAEKDVTGENCNVPLGTIRQSIAECFKYEGAKYRRAYMRARRQGRVNGHPSEH